MLIPKKIFQTVRAYDQLPEDLKKNVENLKRRNADWSYRLFEDEEVKDFIRQHVSAEDWSALLRLNPRYGVVLADLFRYLLLYEEGGVYLDIKSSASRPLSDIIPPDARYIISQWNNRVGELYQGYGLYPELERVPGGEFQQWHIIATPKHPYLKATIEEALYNIRNYSTVEHGVSGIGVFRVAGPICYTRAIWPIFNQPGTFCTDVTDLGISYSIFEAVGDKHRHADLDPGHYSKSTEPIFWRDPRFALFRKARGNLAELLAQELRDNFELVLKLAVASIVASVVFVFFWPLAFWLFH